MPISSNVGDNTEITSTNRPKDAVFDWFLNPLLIIKEQIKAAQLSAAEEDYLGKLVLLSSDPERLKNTIIGPAPDSERKRAELDALARRLQIQNHFLLFFSFPFFTALFSYCHFMQAPRNYQVHLKVPHI